MSEDFLTHDKGICESRQVGSGTRIWAFAHILPGARIGADSNICDHVFIENDVIIGDRVTVKSGVQLWDGLRVENDVFIGPNATFTNDRRPRSRQYPEKYETTILRAGCSIGANATILPGLTVGREAMVGAGAVVTKSVPPYAIVVGNPANITGYVKTHQAEPAGAASPLREPRVGRTPTKVPGVTISRVPSFGDMRGDLSVGEFLTTIPFQPQRYFLVLNVPSREVRGEHAHRECHQFLVCVSGSVHVIVDDGQTREEVVLDSPHLGLHIPPMVWGIQYKYSPGAVLMVLASHPYDPSDYIRDHDSYRELMGVHKTR